jgi:D-sedoheptulose 7-phosphate isomerase
MALFTTTMTIASARVREIFEEGAALKTECATRLEPAIVSASRALNQSILAGNKVLTCGNGGSAADAQHFSSELLNRFERDRAGLPAIALTTDASTITSIANDYDFSQVFAKQIRALGRAGDTLLTFSTSGNSPNIVAAIDAAHEQHMCVILVSGRDGGPAAGRLRANDSEIRVPSNSTARIQEIHLTIIHCLCDLLDREIIGVPS